MNNQQQNNPNLPVHFGEWALDNVEFEQWLADHRESLAVGQAEQPAEEQLILSEAERNRLFHHKFGGEAWQPRIRARPAHDETKLSAATPAQVQALLDFRNGTVAEAVNNFEYKHVAKLEAETLTATPFITLPAMKVPKEFAEHVLGVSHKILRNRRKMENRRMRKSLAKRDRRTSTFLKKQEKALRRASKITRVYEQDAEEMLAMRERNLRQLCAVELPFWSQYQIEHEQQRRRAVRTKKFVHFTIPLANRFEKLEEEATPEEIFWDHDNAIKSLEFWLRRTGHKVDTSYFGVDEQGLINCAAPIAALHLETALNIIARISPFEQEDLIRNPCVLHDFQTGRAALWYKTDGSFFYPPTEHAKDIAHLYKSYLQYPMNQDEKLRLKAYREISFPKVVEDFVEVTPQVPLWEARCERVKRRVRCVRAAFCTRCHRCLPHCSCGNPKRKISKLARRSPYFEEARNRIRRYEREQISAALSRNWRLHDAIERVIEHIKTVIINHGNDHWHHSRIECCLNLMNDPNYNPEQLMELMTQSCRSLGAVPSTYERHMIEVNGGEVQALLPSDITHHVDMKFHPEDIMPLFNPIFQQLGDNVRSKWTHLVSDFLHMVTIMISTKFQWLPVAAALSWFCTLHIEDVSVTALVESVKEWWQRPQAQSAGEDLLSYAGYIGAIALTIIGVVTVHKLPGKGDVNEFFNRFSKVKNMLGSFEEIWKQGHRLAEFFADEYRRIFLGYSKNDLDGWKGINLWCDEVTRLNRVDLEKRLQREETLHEHINTLILRGDNIQKQLDALSIPIAQRQRVQSCVLFLRDAKNLAQGSAPGLTRPRTAPAVVHTYGETGGGKSTITFLLNAFILAKLGCRDPDDLGTKVYYRYPYTEHWDGYTNGVKIVVCDDFGSMKDSAQNPNPEVGEAIRMSNTAFWALPMAHLSNKGTTAFQAELVEWTSNTGFFAFESITNPEAVTRRVDLKFRQRPHPDYALVRNINGKPRVVLNQEKVAAEAVKDPSVLRRCVVFDLMENSYTREQVNIEGLTFDQYAEMVWGLVQYRKTAGATVISNVSKYFEECSSKTDTLKQVDHMLARPAPASLSDILGDLKLATREVEGPLRYSDLLKGEAQNDAEELLCKLHKHEPTLWQRIFGGVAHVNVRETCQGQGDFALDILPLGSRTRWTQLAMAPCIKTHSWKVCDHLAHVLRYAKSEAARYDVVEGNKVFSSIFDAYFKSAGDNDFLPCEEHVKKDPFYPCLWMISNEITGRASSWFEKVWTVLKKAILKVIDLIMNNGALRILALIMGAMGAVYLGAKLVPKSLGKSWMEKSALFTVRKHYEQTLESEEAQKLSCNRCPCGCKTKLQDLIWDVDECQAVCKLYVNEEHLNIGYDVNGKVKTYVMRDLELTPVEFEDSRRMREAIKTKAFLANAQRQEAESVSDKTNATPRTKVESVNEKTLAAQRSKIESSERMVAVKFDNVQASLDQNAQEICGRVLPNLYVLERKSEEGWSHVQNLVVLSGRVALVNRHICSLKHHTEWRVRNHFLPSGFEFRLWDLPASFPDEEGPHAHKDVMMFEMPRRFPLHRSLVPYFMTSEDFGRHRTLAAGAVQFAGLLHTVKNMEVPIARFATTSMVVARDGEYPLFRGSEQVGLVRNFYLHQVPTVKGDCGGVFCAMDSNYERKLLGLHAAGAESPFTGMVTPVTQELIARLQEKLHLSYPESFIGTNVQTDDGLDVTITEELVECDAFPGFIPVGSNQAGAYVPPKSSIRPSPVHGLIQEPLTKPAYLRPVKVNGKFVDPQEVGRAKAAHLSPPLPSPILDAAINDYQQMIMRNIEPNDQKVLTFEEAIAGVEGDEFISAINRGSSPGYGWKKIGKGKTAYLGSEEYNFSHPEVLKRYAEMMSVLQKGERPCVLWQDTLKDERRPIEKVNQGKTRLFACGEMIFTIIFRRYFAGWCAHMARNRITMESCIGTNPYSLDWDRLARFLQEVGPHVIAGDFTNYDGSLHTDILWRLLDVVNAFYGDGELNAKIRRGIWCEVVNSIHITGRTVYMWTHSQPSGCPATAIINSAYHSISARMVWLICAKQHRPEFATMKHFRRYVRHANYGDDDVWNIHPEVIEWFNQETITEAYATFGMTYTDEAKSGKIVRSRTLPEVNFLKRKFRWDGQACRYRAPLAEETILEMAMWTKGNNDQWTICAQTLEIAAYEAAQFEKQEFQRLISLLEPARSIVNERVRVNFLTFEEYQEGEWVKYVAGVI